MGVPWVAEAAVVLDLYSINANLLPINDNDRNGPVVLLST
jgi:hypothetical protein